MYLGTNPDSYLIIFTAYLRCRSQLAAVHRVDFVDTGLSHTKNPPSNDFYWSYKTVVAVSITYKIASVSMTFMGFWE